MRIRAVIDSRPVVKNGGEIFGKIGRVGPHPAEACPSFL